MIAELSNNRHQKEPKSHVYSFHLAHTKPLYECLCQLSEVLEQKGWEVEVRWSKRGLTAGNLIADFYAAGERDGVTVGPLHPVSTTGIYHAEVGKRARAFKPPPSTFQQATRARKTHGGKRR